MFEFKKASLTEEVESPDLNPIKHHGRRIAHISDLAILLLDDYALKSCRRVGAAVATRELHFLPCSLAISLHAFVFRVYHSWRWLSVMLQTVCVHIITITAYEERHDSSSAFFLPCVFPPIEA